ncbi:MAG: S8 family serine peptidase [Gammaproteobacteria bacterium]|nr:S8 family serine peptidase [Gammaproteobacteria bacterium]
MLIGIIDTGINTDHPSFAEVSPGDGFVHTNPLGDGVFLRDCAPFDSVTNPNGGQPELCNNKLIGTMALPGAGQTNAEDSNGHGSHTAGVAGGNLILDVPFVDVGGSPTGIVFDQISGVAPHANIVAYLACGEGGCQGADLIAAIDAATADGVDAINYSIGGGPDDPWNDADSLALLGSRDAGIFVATSVGQSGPGAGTIGSPANAPWLTSAAASTHQRGWSEKMVVELTGGDTTPPGDFPGRGATGGYGPAPIVYAGDFGDPLCPLGEFAPGTFNAAIVLCDRGAFALVDKAQSAFDGGAGAVIIANTATSAGDLSDIPYVVPAILIEQQYGDPLRDWLATGTGHMGRITASTPIIDLNLADVVGGFSSRGPNGLVPDIISPSVAAPGVDIYSAYATPIEYASLSGSSGAAPHVVGAGALLRQVHPGWSAAEIHSALVSTGQRDMTQAEDGLPATAFAMGGGRIQVDLAANAGLVMHETTVNFQAANPAVGGDPTTLNLPAFANGECLEICTWERTVRATTSGTWTAGGEGSVDLGIEISPASFTLSEGETQTITVTADVQRLLFDEWAFGWVNLTPDNGAIASQSMPVAVQPTAGVLPDDIKLNVRRDAGTLLVGGFTTAELIDLSLTPFGLAIPAITTVMIEGDNGGEFSPFTPTGVDVSFYDVAPGSILFSASTANSTAPDVDLFVGRDNNGDSQITEDEVLCESGNPADVESCSLSGPVVAQGGSFWVAVVAFEASAEPVDSTELTVFSAAPSDGNFYVEPPAVINAGEEWQIRVGWGLESLAVGDRRLGVIDVAAEGSSLAIIPVELERIEDDVRVSASASHVVVGDVVDMHIEVDANLTPEDLAYTIDAVIPEGFELVPDSASAGEGELVFINGMLFWSLDNPSLSTVPHAYVPAINGPGVDTADPLYNAACDTGFGGYVDLESFGIDADPSISGDSVSFLIFEGQNLPFYNLANSGFTITDDGFGVFASGLGTTPWQNTDIPNPAEPNDMIAFAWKDLEIVYDEAGNSGVTVTAPGPNLSIVEFDDMQPWPAGSTSDRIDFELIVNGVIDDRPNEFELVLTYDNIVGDWSDSTTGVENQDGSAGSQYQGQLSDGLMICYDLVGPDISPKTLDYQVRVVEGAEGAIVHQVFSVLSNPGSREAVAEVVVNVAADSDDDGVSDNNDNCTLRQNSDQTDTDNDGYGNACDADFNQDNYVNYFDLGIMRDMFETATPLGDLNNDGWVDFADVGIMKSLFLLPPGPSALAN